MDVENDMNEALMNAISDCNANLVKHCLENGANPNYYADHEWYKDSPESQPNTPLKLVMFRASDNLLTEDNLQELKIVAKLLLKAGADPKPARVISEIRYGKYEKNKPENAFDEILLLIH